MRSAARERPAARRRGVTVTTVVSVGPRVTQAQRRARTPRGYYVVLSHATRALYCCVPAVAFSALGSRHAVLKRA